MPDGAWNCRKHTRLPQNIAPFTPPSTCWMAYVTTPGIAPRRYETMTCARPSRAPSNCCCNTNSSAPTRPAKSSIPGFCSFSYPPYWHYDMLRALSYWHAQSPAQPALPGCHGSCSTKNAMPTASGLCRIAIRAMFSSIWRRSAGQAAGTRLRALRILRWWQS